MKIKTISFPEDSALEGWRKLVTIRRLHRAFDGDSFSVCDLDRCREAVLGESGGSYDVYKELDAFHCVSYADMSTEESAMVIQKASEFVGVKLTMENGVISSRKVIPYVAVCVAVCVALLALAAVILPIRKEAAAKGESGVRPIQPAFDSIGVVRPDYIPPADPIFTVTFNANEPRKAVTNIVPLVPNDAGDYEVTVTVTPLSPKQKKDQEIAHQDRK